MDMRFRQYVATRTSPVTLEPLAEADLLGVPGSGSSAESPKKPSPLEPKKPDESQSGRTPNKPGPLSGDLDEQARRAAMLVGELVRLLAALPPPLKEQFYALLHPLRTLLGKLQDNW